MMGIDYRQRGRMSGEAMLAALRAMPSWDFVAVPDFDRADYERVFRGATGIESYADFRDFTDGLMDVLGGKPRAALVKLGADELLAWLKEKHERATPETVEAFARVKHKFRQKRIDECVEIAKRAIVKNDGADRVVLATYTEEEFKELHRGAPPHELQYHDHLEIVAGLAAGLKRAFPEVEVVYQPIEAAEYWRWLAKHSYPDKECYRAAFATEKYDRLHDAE